MFWLPRSVSLSLSPPFPAKRAAATWHQGVWPLPAPTAPGLCPPTASRFNSISWQRASLVCLPRYSPELYSAPTHTHEDTKTSPPSLGPPFENQDLREQSSADIEHPRVRVRVRKGGNFQNTGDRRGGRRRRQRRGGGKGGRPLRADQRGSVFRLRRGGGVAAGARLPPVFVFGTLARLRFAPGRANVYVSAFAVSAFWFYSHRRHRQRQG